MSHPVRLKLTHEDLHISLNNIVIFCLHIFVYVFSSCRIDFMVSGGNWLMKFTKLIGILVLSDRSWAITRSVYIVKVICPLHIHYYFVSVYYLYRCVVEAFYL